MTSISTDKKIRFGAKRAYLHTASNRFFTDSNVWGTECLCVDIRVHTAHTRTKAPVVAIPPPKCMLCVRKFSNSLTNSNIDTKFDGQEGSMSGSYFGSLGFKPLQADRLL